MGENTKIAWAHHTFNPWIGCSKVHTGCKYCYAEKDWDKRRGRVKWGEDGTRDKTKTWGEPKKWNRRCAAGGFRQRVFCASLADIFEDRPELAEWRRELFDLIDNTPFLDWLLLTKRPENIQAMWPGGLLDKRRHNVWLGTSVSNQETADTWIDRLLKSRELSKYVFVSYEPALAMVDFSWWIDEIDQIIVGGESGPNARPFDVRWAHYTVEQCRISKTACLVKQMGSNPVGITCRHPKGEDLNEWPEELRVQQFPGEPLDP